MAVQVSIKDRNAANAWLENVRDINQDYSRAMEEAGRTLIEMKDFADGTLVDEFYNYGNTLLDAAKKTFEVIDEIADTVNKILSAVEEFAESAVGGILKTLGKVF